MRNDVVNALCRALSDASLLGPNATLLAAVSGGADSVALLHGLAALRQETGFALCAVHVEHGLRGEASLRDAAFVEALCKRLAVPLRLYHGEGQGSMESPGAEALARDMRRRFFAKAMGEQNADALLTAHHQDDQAETVLMRLLRGAGARGLSAMKSRQSFAGGLLLRPFLSLPGAAFPQFLTALNEAWQEDESNGMPCCLRNRLRLEVFPLLEALQPQARAHMAEAAQRLAWDEECLGALADKILAKVQVSWPSAHALRLQPVLEAPMAIALRVLRGWAAAGFSLPEGERALSHGDTMRLYALAASAQRGSLNLPGNLKADRTAGYLHLSRQDGAPLVPPEPLPAAALRPKPESFAFGRVNFSLSAHALSDSLPDGRGAVLVKDSLLRSGLVLRNPAPGDRIHPFGAPGHKALRRHLTDQKVDESFRLAWPVLARGSEILWVAGVGASEETRVGGEEEEGLWRLAVEGSLPLIR